MQKSCECDIEQYRVLVIEDIEETRDGLERLLRADGYRVLCARNEEEGCRPSDFTPDLILIGMGAPAQRAVDAGRNIRVCSQSDAGTPIVIFSVEGLNEGDEIDAGQNTYLVKPENFDQVRALLQRLLAERKVSDRASLDRQ